MHVVCAARTDVGLIRSGNEDNYVMIPERGIFVVADGMGGHAAGEIASEMAVQLISRDLGSFKGLSTDDAAARMTRAIKAANAAIFERTLSEHDKRGMGTTCTGLVLHGHNRYLIGQVGIRGPTCCARGGSISSRRTTPTCRSRWTRGT